MFSFCVGLFVARYVTPEEFGLLVAAYSMAQVVRVPFSIGIYNKLAGAKCLTYSLLGAGFCISVLQFLGALLLALVLFPWYARVFGVSFAHFVVIFSILNLAISLKDVLVAKMFFDRKYKKYFLVEVIGAVVSACVVISSVMLHMNYTAITLQFYAHAIIFAVLGMIILRPWRSLGHKMDYKILAKNIKSYIVLSITNNCLRDVDKLVLGSTASPALVGIYSRATRFSKIFGVLIPVGVVRSILPAFKKTIDSGNDLTEVYMNYLRNFLYILVPVALLVGFQAENILRFLYGNQWISAAPILSVLMFNVVLMPVRGLTEQVSYAHARPKPLAKLSVVSILIYAIAMYFFIERFGIMGAAVSLVVHTGITFSGAIYLATKYIRLSLCVNYCCKVLGGCIFVYVVLTLTTGMMVQKSLAVSLLFKSTLVLISYFTVMFALDQRFRHLVVSIIRQKNALSF